MLSNKRPTPSTKTEIKNISVSGRALIYMFSMGILGAAVGMVDSKIAIKQCSNTQDCAIANPGEMKLGKIGMGACAGMVAATVLSIPAILNED